MRLETMPSLPSSPILANRARPSQARCSLRSTRSVALSWANRNRKPLSLRRQNSPHTDATSAGGRSKHRGWVSFRIASPPLERLHLLFGRPISLQVLAIRLCRSHTGPVTRFLRAFREQRLQGERVMPVEPEDLQALMEFYAWAEGPRPR